MGQPPHSQTPPPPGRPFLPSLGFCFDWFDSLEPAGNVTSDPDAFVIT